MSGISVDIDEVKRIAVAVEELAFDVKLATAPNVAPSASQAVNDAIAAFHDALAASVASACVDLENAGASIKLAADDFAVTEVSVSDLVETFSAGLL